MRLKDKVAAITGAASGIGKAIALARVPAGTGGMAEVEVRGRRLAARVVKPPFVRNGEACV